MVTATTEDGNPNTGSPSLAMPLVVVPIRNTARPSVAMNEGMG
jgi:hypothetical protein